MTDWKVKVETQDHQIRTVTVFDFVYPSDASRAALSQSAGHRVISVVPIYHDDDDRYNYYINPEPLEPRTYSSSNKEETEADWFMYYLVATSIPTGILLLINPVFAIIFNIIFLWWWYKK